LFFHIPDRTTWESADRNTDERYRHGLNFAARRIRTRTEQQSHSKKFSKHHDYDPETAEYPEWEDGKVNQKATAKARA
jgi:hypothetical protein